MPKKHEIRKCPNCGSKNVQHEKYGKKGRQLFVCAECDYEFELRVGKENNKTPKIRELE